jgi:hypothetical protein
MWTPETFLAAVRASKISWRDANEVASDDAITTSVWLQAMALAVHLDNTNQVFALLHGAPLDDNTQATLLMAAVDAQKAGAVEGILDFWACFGVPSTVDTCALNERLHVQFGTETATLLARTLLGEDA